MRHGYFFPFFIGKEHSIQRGEKFGEKLFGIEIFQQNEEVIIRVFYPESAKENEIKDLATKWAHAIGIFENLEKMRKEFSEDKVYKVLEQTKGYHFIGSINPFEILISAIVSQNIKAEKFRNLLEKMTKTLGEKFGEFYVFPPLQKIATSEEILKKLGFGYRAKYVTYVSGWLIKNAKTINLHEPTNKLLRQLISIKSVGNYTATSFLLYGLKRYDAPLYDGLIRKICSGFLGKRIKNFSEFDTITWDSWGQWRGAIIAHLCVFYRIKNKLGRLV